MKAKANPNNPYEMRIVDEIENLAKDSNKIPNLDKIYSSLSLPILKILLSYACAPTTPAYILFAREVIKEISAIWLIDYLPAAVKDTLNINDEWEYRRLLESIEYIPALVDYYIQLGLKSTNEEVIEAANDYKQILEEQN